VEAAGEPLAIGEALAGADRTPACSVAEATLSTFRMLRLPDYGMQHVPISSRSRGHFVQAGSSEAPRSSSVSARNLQLFVFLRGTRHEKTSAARQILPQIAPPGDRSIRSQTRSPEQVCRLRIDSRSRGCREKITRETGSPCGRGKTTRCRRSGSRPAGLASILPHFGRYLRGSLVSGRVHLASPLNPRLGGRIPLGRNREPSSKDKFLSFV
jgi:hypothetical protein